MLTCPEPRRSAAESAPARPTSQRGHVVVGGVGRVRGVGEDTEVGRRGQAALEGVQRVHVGDVVTGQRVHPQVQLAVQPVVGALPGVQRGLVGLGEVVQRDEDAGAVVVGGPQSGFSSPDNMVFDPYGNLWMVTDSGTGENTIYDFLGNNSMFFMPTEGPDVGRAFRFAVGPVEAELTGPVFSPDGKTLFLSVQHPGEDSESLDALTSSFAAAPGTAIPRPTLVAIRGFPGWGTDV